MLCWECHQLGVDTGYAESCQACGVVAELPERYVRGLSVYIMNGGAKVSQVDGLTD